MPPRKEKKSKSILERVPTHKLVSGIKRDLRKILRESEAHKPKKRNG